MAGKNQVSGKITISTPTLGVIRSMPGASMKFGTVKRDPVEDDQGVAGYTETNAAPRISATFVKKAGVSAKAIADIVNEDITFEADDGSHYVLRQAWCADQVDVKAGEIAVEFIGIDVDEVTA